MTETLTNAETQPANLGRLVEGWVANPPPSLSEALAQNGLDAEALENYVRSGISTEEVEALRKVLVQGAASGKPEDPALLARLTPLLDPRERAWDRLLRAKNSGEVLTAVVTEAVKGGVVVDLGVRGFVPSSQLGLSVPKNLEQYVGQTLRLRVTDIDRRRHTVILSNRQIAEEERASKRRSALERLEEGQVRKGTVRRLTDIGAFVDVGGVDGLLHVSEISWKRVEHPSDVLKVGQKIDVKVLRVDPAAGRISLSMRHLAADPWEEIRKKYSIGSTVKVKILNTVAQGAVVELDQGFEGFIPISELADRRINSPEEVVQPGQEVDALVLDLRPRERRVVFSLRKLEQKRERDEVRSYQKRTTRGDRLTLGDLFGHLFEEYQPEDEKPAEAAPAGAAEPATEAATTEAATTEAATTEAAATEAATTEAAATEAATTEAATTEAATTEAPAEQTTIADAGPETATVETTGSADTRDDGVPAASEPVVQEPVATVQDESGTVPAAVATEAAGADSATEAKPRRTRKKAEPAEDAAVPTDNGAEDEAMVAEAAEATE